MKLSGPSWIMLAVFVAFAFAFPALAADGGSAHAAHSLDGRDIKIWLVLPFIGILLSIAILPLVAPHFWHHHYGKVSAAWSILGAGALFIAFAGKTGEVSHETYSVGTVIHDLAHVILLDYVPFIILLLGLFTIAGGIRITGSLRGSPMLNTGMLIIGWFLASLMGTTGASMLMIRPLIQANAWREKKAHLIVFFIFLVSNMGGALTPLGDPPLFLGFLRGVSFEWTLLNIWGESLVGSAILLVMFFVLDTIMLKREKMQAPPIPGSAAVATGPVRTRHTKVLQKDGGHGAAAAVALPTSAQGKFGMEGKINFLLLAALIAAILVSSSLGNTTFKDMVAEQKYTAALNVATERTGALKYALDNVDKDFDKAAKGEAGKPNGYLLAMEKSRQLETEMAKLDEGHGHAADSHDANAAATHKRDEHGHADDDPFFIQAATLTDVGKPLAGGLDKRYDALRKNDAKADVLKPLILRDFKKAESEANGLRERQGVAATKAVALPGPVPGIPYTNLMRDVIILILVFLSLKLTNKESRKANGFSWAPIVEVAKLFIGIFICMVPALKILSAGLDGALAGVVGAVTGPGGDPVNWKYFWFTGTLSSFLDNAPTYLVFFNTAGGDASTLMTAGAGTLAAISCGAVFMGANTYIGNAPNFMVKAIAEESGIKMPSFFGYMAWSVLILVPVFIVLTFLFFMTH